MSYGKAWEKYPIKKGEVWANGNACISVCDITENIPPYMYEADMIYCDPPWSLGLVNMFNSKVGRRYMNSFDEFYNPLFGYIKEVKAKCCYLEIGKAALDVFIVELTKIYPCVDVWEITYYKIKPCYLVRGGHSSVDANFSGQDDAETPLLAIKAEKPNIVADLCTGRGLTGMAALEHGCKFVGTEINERKLALFIQKAKSKQHELKKIQ